ncbi:MAG: type II toxin-antitoxin system PemK/MazF family toxin [Lachnospiraceae bacterium]|nr:type II toxin-antitoxin system PemK/MazF family toxin [Lachnospiraceae bacterium]
MNIDLNRTQQYLEWLKDKLYLNAIAEKAKERTVYRGQVYRCKFGVGVGSEECKERPCVILQYNSANKTSPNVLVAPITHSSSKLPVVVPITDKKNKDGATILNGNVLLGNITCISKARLGDYVTDLTKEEMKAVDKALSISLDVWKHYQSLQNAYDDKLIYIDKLKQINSAYKETLAQYKDLLNQYHIMSVDELKKFLEKVNSND